jgi:hypothetical protein
MTAAGCAAAPLLLQRGNPTAIWTIGHSTRSIEKVLSLLVGSRIEVIADARSFPGPRKYPQYGREALAAKAGWGQALPARHGRGVSVQPGRRQLTICMT